MTKRSSCDARLALVANALSNASSAFARERSSVAIDSCLTYLISSLVFWSSCSSFSSSIAIVRDSCQSCLSHDSAPTSQFSRSTISAELILLLARLLLRPAAVRVVAVLGTAQESVLVRVISVSTATGARSGGRSGLVLLWRNIAVASIAKKVAFAGIRIEATVSGVGRGTRSAVVTIRAVSALVSVLFVAVATSVALVRWRRCGRGVRCHGVQAWVLAGQTDRLSLSNIVSNLLVRRHGVGERRRGVGVGVGIVFLLPIEKTHFELVDRRSKV